MKVLITVSSRHGATLEIGEEIAATLERAGIEVALLPPEAVGELRGYDAVIVGSALYFGRWMDAAREFVEGHADSLRKLPVWLFASGQVTPVESEGDVAEGLRLKELVAARDARVFAGRLKKDGLNILERVPVAMIKSPWGDYRPWDEIRRWSADIAVALIPEAVAAG